MSRRTRTYVAFDADTDMDWYRMLTAWAANDANDFELLNSHELTEIRPDSEPETIKRSLRRRMDGSRMLIVLIGANTRKLRQYLPYEINLALEAQLPIIGVNLNKVRGYDAERCPASMRDELVVHVSYEQAIIKCAMDNWPAEHDKLAAQGTRGQRSYGADVYKRYGL